LRSDSPRAIRNGPLGWIGLAVLLIFAAGCRQDMHDQPRYEPFEQNSFFADGRAARPPIPGTVPYGSAGGDPVFLSGRSGGALATALPFEVTRERLERGRERFEIFCAPCHDRLGYGDGMIVRRGFPRPNSYHTERLRSAPVGHFFDVITNGIGPMGDFADRVSPEDRWNIAAYIRVLQISQQSKLENLPPEVREEFLKSVP
jgi:cytochrome c553